MTSVWAFFFSSRRRHTRSVSAFLLSRSSDLIGRMVLATLGSKNHTTNITKIVTQSIGIIIKRSEERRVGKECRSRWSVEHVKKKQKQRGKDDIGNAQNHSNIEVVIDMRARSG